MPATAKLRVLGITDEFTECQCCGRNDLKSTVCMESLDSEGNGTGELVYYGSSCAATAIGIVKDTKARTEKRIRNLANSGVEQKRQEIFAKYCRLIETEKGGFFILQETQLSKIVGTMEQRIQIAVQILNDKFPILK